MKKFYILVPIILTGVFIFVYMNFAKDYALEQEREAQEKAAVAQAEADRKAENERIAKADAERRAADRAAEEARKDAERRQKWEDAGKEIADASAKFNADADKYAKEAAELEIQLANTRDLKEKASREAFELAKRVELARIAKRNAELEIQRMTEMIARRAAESAMTQVAAAVPPKK